MPQIIVTADRRPDRGDGAVLLRERVTVSDFESDHFVVHLVEPLPASRRGLFEAPAPGARQHDAPS